MHFQLNGRNGDIIIQQMFMYILIRQHSYKKKIVRSGIKIQPDLLSQTSKVKQQIVFLMNQMKSWHKIYRSMNIVFTFFADFKLKS